MVPGLYLIIWWTQAWWWLVAALAAFVVTILLGQLVPVLIMPLFYKIERLDDDDLLRRFDRLTRGTTLNIEGVYRMQLSTETAKANAHAGRAGAHAARDPGRHVAGPVSRPARSKSCSRTRSATTCTTTSPR